MDSPLYQVEELVDGMVTESGAVTDQALGTQSTSLTNSDGYYYVKQELQSDDEEDHPAPLDFCPVSPNSEQLFETEQNQNFPIVECVGSLRQPPLVEQHQNGGLSQRKGLPTSCPQLIAHRDADMEFVDDRLENKEKRCSTIDHVSVKQEVEDDEYYILDVVHQPENAENQTSAVTSAQLEENVWRVSDSKERKGKMKGKNEESQKGNMTSDEREVLLWNRENTSTEVAELDNHGLPTPCPQHIAHHDTDMEVVDDRLENKEKQHVPNTINNIGYVIVKEEPERDDDCTRDLLYQSIQTYERNTENERSDIKLESVIESGGKSDKMEEKKEESEELQMSVEEEEDFCQEQENSLSDIANKKEHAENMRGKKWSDSMRPYTYKPQRQQKDKQEKFQCKLCSYTTIDKWNLYKHQRRHILVKPFVCKLCEFSTHWKSHLLRHISKHAQEKTFVCEVCGFSTNSESNLNLHKRRHVQEKPFVCGVCGYSAKWQSCLTLHKRTHTGEKRYKCNMCSMQFSIASTLHRHVTTQHDKNAHLFQCRFCEYASKDKQCTKRHEVRVHTKEYPRECKVCKMGFFEPSRLEKHMISKHKQK